MTAPVVILAGGGTGGHVFPMVAVADALRAEAEVRVVYVGTERGIEASVVPARGDELEVLPVLPIKGKGIAGALRGAGRAASTLPSARSLVKRLGARAVLAVGGYAAGPVGIAAWSAGVPLAILEPNSVLGLTNRWLRPFACRVYVAFEETAAKLPARIALRTGVPLRRAFAPVPYQPSRGRFRVLVLGGSQGAKALNEAVPVALSQAASEIEGLTVLHQAGRGKDADVRGRYGELAVRGVVEVVPFIDDVASELARADLVIARSGAGSVAETCAVGRASLLIPLPSLDDHQKKNADAVGAVGAAAVIVQANANASRLVAEIVALAADEARRVRMARAARAEGRPDAARALARDLLAVAGIAPRSPHPTPQGATSAGDPPGAAARPRREEAAHV